MKYLLLTLSSIYLVFMVSCGSNAVDDHDHETDQHTHQGEDQPHSHEGEELTTVLPEDQSGHLHETDDPGHTHETDDPEHIHETDDPGHTHETDDPGHTHEVQDTASVSDEETDDHDLLPHTVLKLQRKDFSSVIKTSGQIIVDKKDDILVTAKSAGVIRFKDDFLFEGVRVKRNQTLFSVSGENITENNIGVNYARVKSDYEIAEANYNRAKELVGSKLVTQEYFLDTKGKFEKLKAEYLNLNITVTNNTSIVSSPNDGYIKEIYVTEGQNIVPGEQLASIIIEHNLVLKADVAPGSLSELQNIEGANFMSAYNSKVYCSEDMNGKLISYGRSTGNTSYYIPVYFRMDYTPELIPGTFVDVWLTGKKITNVLTVPNSSIMEEFGKFYVFVETDDGEFLKHYFTPGQTNGLETQVLDGLEEGDLVVATGAYQVKLAQLGSAAPDSHQGHSH